MLFESARRSLCLSRRAIVAVNHPRLAPKAGREKMRPNTEFSVFTSTTSGPDAVSMTRAGSSRGGSSHPLSKQARVVVVGDTCVSEEGMAAIVGRDKRYHVCGGAHGFYDAGELIRKHQPDVLLIEPFLADRDGIRWVKDLATEFLRTHILIVSRLS